MIVFHLPFLLDNVETTQQVENTNYFFTWHANSNQIIRNILAHVEHVDTNDLSSYIQNYFSLLREQN